MKAALLCGKSGTFSGQKRHFDFVKAIPLKIKQIEKKKRDVFLLILKNGIRKKNILIFYQAISAEP